MFPTFASFDEVMKQCTQDRECMVIDQGSLSYNISDSVYFYKATPDLNYRVCADEYWQFSERSDTEQQADEGSDSDDEVPRPKEDNVRVKKRYPGHKRPKYKDAYRNLLNYRDYNMS